MKLDLIGSRIVKCNYSNDIEPDNEVNLQVTVNTQIKLPNDLKSDSVGSIRTKVLVGTPLEPLCIYVEQISNFMDTDKKKESNVPDMEEMMSLYKMICVPLALNRMDETLDGLCKVYGIPKIEIKNIK